MSVVAVLSVVVVYCLTFMDLPKRILTDISLGNLDQDLLHSGPFVTTETLSVYLIFFWDILAVYFIVVRSLQT